MEVGLELQTWLGPQLFADVSILTGFLSDCGGQPPFLEVSSKEADSPLA